MNRLLVIVFLLMNSCFSGTTYGQDTLSLFYATAKYRLTDDHQTQLNYFIDLHDVGLMDSIQIIGVADSSGNIVSNQRLSLRRASHVESFFQDHHVKNKMVLLAKGEDPELQSLLQKQRRVDIIFFYPTSNSVESISSVIDDEVDSSCYTSADFILNHCFQTVIQKGNKTYVQLELDPKHYSESIRVYSVVEDQKTGFPILRLVKWKSNLSGEDWWRKKRYIATIKKEDFDRFKIVEKSDKPCDSLPLDCGFKLTDKYVELKTTRFLYLAYFLMKNANVKKRLFKRKKLRVEVPKIYVGNEQYFIDSQGKTPVVWYTKRGKRHRSSYFTDVSFDSKDNYSIAFYNYYYVSYCHSDNYIKNRLLYGSIDSEKSDFICGTKGSSGGSTFFSFELGDRMLTPNHFGYVGMYGKCTFRSSELDIFLGIDTEWDPFISARFDYHFIGLNQNGFLRKPAVYYQNMFGLYGGTTLDVIAPDVQRLTTSQDLHLGLDYTLSYSNKPFHRIYLEAGPMIHYTNLSEPISMQYRLGIQFRF